MSSIVEIARKELRAWFESPVALLFLGAFLATTLLGFFTLSAFFARNLADLRPLWAWLPLLLILLVSAITMRQWAEERARGTLEVLLTTPVRTWELVAGKFLAGVALVALALALTLPLTFTVASLGELDWGPVLGGYIGALLLGAAYLAMGLSVSARTDNPVVALMGTLLVGGAFFFVGHPSFTGFFGDTTAEILRSIGTGSRFESIARGVLDLGDLAYYASLALTFLVVNVHVLEIDRIDPTSPHGAAARRRRLLNGSLVAINAVLLSAWLSPLHGLRVDMTRDGLYSLSQATETTLSHLDEPLYLDGYFSDKTHPLLSPLVPRVKDLLKEYEAIGGGKVKVRFADPSTDEALEQELGQAYGIRSVPLAVSERNSQAVVNAFFHVLVRYGDQHAVLGFDDLIEVQASATDGLTVELRNLEYDLTSAIRKASQDFESVDSLIARLPRDAKVTLYATHDSTPESFVGAVDDLRTLGAELQDKGMPFEEIAPPLDEDAMIQLADELGVRPMAADLFGQHLFYGQLVLSAGDQHELVTAGGELSDTRRDVEAAVRRLSPGQLETVGILTEVPEAEQQSGLPPQYQQPPPRPDYQRLEAWLGDEYQVERPDLSEGEPPDNVDVLIVGKPGALSDKERFALDQYLMRGGSVVALAGAWAADASSRSLSVKENDGDLADLLEAWGVSVGDKLVADPQNASFPMPVQERRGPFLVNSVQMLPYPFFPDIRAGGFDRGHPVFASLPNVTVPWSSPLTVSDSLPEGVEAETLLTTSDGSWLTEGIDPDFKAWPDAGFGPSGEQAPRVVAVSLSGALPSAFAGDEERPGEGALDVALPGARLTVIGSAEIASDLMLGVAEQMSGEVHRANLGLLANLVDWSVEDTDLLSIRRPGAFSQTLRPMSDDERRRWEVGNYGAAFALLLGLAWAGRRRRRRARPLTALVAHGGVA